MPRRFRVLLSTLESSTVAMVERSRQTRTLLCIRAVILLKPVETMASPLLIIGWCMVYYGVAEALNSLKVYQLQRQFRKDEEASIVVGEPQETSDEED